MQKVLFITADQWRGDALGCLGHPAAKTPHLDALASDATLFAQHYTCSVPCGPARTTLLTGLYPFIHRSVRNGTPLDKRHSNIALEVRKAGRDPVLFGYTDSSADPRELAPEDPRLKSFEGVLPGFRLEATLNESYLTGWLTKLAKKGYHIPDQHMDIYRHVDEPQCMERFSRAPARFTAGDSDTAYIADAMIDYLRLRYADNWFIHGVFLRPHPPIIAPTPYNVMVDVADVPGPVRHESREQEAAQHTFLASWLARQHDPDYFESQVNVQVIPEEDREAMRAVYFGLIAEVDHQVGRIIDHLKSTGEYDNTLIIFSSDHGEMLGDHWLWGKGGWYDAAYHIPLIIRDPNATSSARGSRVEEFTESVDIMPTILKWLDLEVPVECNGLDLGPWLRGKKPELWRRSVFWEFDFRTPHELITEQTLGLSSDECTLDVIRDDAFKYVHFTSLPPLFYDLRADPRELNNLADDPAYATTVATYAQKLLSHRMLHAERTLTNSMLSPSGVVAYRGERGTPAQLFARPGGSEY